MWAFDHLEWTYDGAFEQLFSLGSGEFEQKFSKNSNARGGGMFKLRFDWCIKDQGVPGVSPVSSTKMTSDPTSGIISSCASSSRASTIWKEIIRNRNARQCLTFISVNHVFRIKHCCAVKFKFTVFATLGSWWRRNSKSRAPSPSFRVNTLCLETSKQRTYRFINILHYTKKN